MKQPLIMIKNKIKNQLKVSSKSVYKNIVLKDNIKTQNN